MTLSVHEMNLDGRLSSGRLDVLLEHRLEVRFIEHVAIASAKMNRDGDAPNDVAKAIVSTGNTGNAQRMQARRYHECGAAVAYGPFAFCLLKTIPSFERRSCGGFVRPRLPSIPRERVRRLFRLLPRTSTTQSFSTYCFRERAASSSVVRFATAETR